MSSGTAAPEPAAAVRDRDLLERVPYFRSLPAGERRALRGRFRSRSFAKAATIFTEGDPCDGLWVVAGGRVKVFRLSPRGREQVLHVEGPGATLGEVPLFDGGGYVASAAALDPARLLWLPRRELEALCRRHPDVALAIVATMAQRVRAFAGLAGDLSLRPVGERLTRLLLEEARRSGRATVQGIEISLPGTRDDLAAQIGTVREPVSRALAQLRRRGLVQPRGQGRLLLNVVGLLESLDGN